METPCHDRFTVQMCACVFMLILEMKRIIHVFIDKRADKLLSQLTVKQSQNDSHSGTNRPKNIINTKHLKEVCVCMKERQRA